MSDIRAAPPTAKPMNSRASASSCGPYRFSNSFKKPLTARSGSWRSWPAT